MVLEEFVRDYSSMLTGSQMAKKKKLNQKSVANVLKEMEKEGLLKSKTSGKNKLFFLNLDDKETIVNFISAVEHLRVINFYKKNPLIKEIATKIIPYCNGIAVIFGSYVKGTKKGGSDLDLFIAGNCKRKKIAKISEAYRLDISIKNYPVCVFNKALSGRDFLINEVVKDHIIILGVQMFVSKLIRFRYGKD
jgi:predicted nucleotidyltransferase